MVAGHTAKHASWAYAEEHSADDPLYEQARLRAAELGSQPISEGTATALTVFAAAVGASAMVEVGTGVGISGVALLRGANHEAVLTSIDPDADHIAAARSLFRQESIPLSRTRLITSRADQVLPRLTAGGYDLVFVDAPAADAPGYASEAIRLLRLGGLLVVNDALDGDRVPKPAVRQDSTQFRRELENALREDDRVITALFPTGSGLLTAVRR